MPLRPPTPTFTAGATASSSSTDPLAGIRAQFEPVPGCLNAATSACHRPRAGRVRIAFHIWNTSDDVDLVAAALSSVTIRD